LQLHGIQLFYQLFENNGKSKIFTTGHKFRKRCNCALKIVDKELFWEIVKRGGEKKDAVVREASVQNALSLEVENYPILKLNGFFETSKSFVFELELLNGTDLFEYVLLKGLPSERHTSHIMRDILRCILTMKKRGIAHRDIKLANILMSNTVGSYDGVVKLADFGMASFEDSDELLHGRCGTPGFVAPEILCAKAGDGYLNNVDMFSAGVVLYVLLCGYEPFSGETDSDVLAANKSANVVYQGSEWDSGT